MSTLNLCILVLLLFLSEYLCPKEGQSEIFRAKMRDKNNSFLIFICFKRFRILEIMMHRERESERRG